MIILIKVLSYVGEILNCFETFKKYLQVPFDVDNWPLTYLCLLYRKVMVKIADLKVWLGILDHIQAVRGEFIAKK